MKTMTIEKPTTYTAHCEVPAWDEQYLILPGAYEVLKQEYFPGHPFDVIHADVEVVYAKKAALFGGVAMTKATGPEKGTRKKIEIPVSKILTLA